MARMSSNISDSVPRLKRWLPRLRGKRIGVLGDLMLDRYLWGTASRLSPEAAVPVVDFVEQSECLGGAGNVAVNIAALGGKVEAFGVIGTEEAGRAVQKCLHAANIADKGVVADPKRITTVKTRIIARHLLPNVLAPVVVAATLGIGGAIMAEAALSFVGLGAQPPTPSWGAMVSDGRDLLRVAPWVSLFPGVAIGLTVLGVNLLGDGLRDALDVRVR